MKERTKIIVSLLVVCLLCVFLVWFFVLQTKEAKEQESLDKLSSSIEESNQTSPHVPDANPIDEAVIDPLQKTNPFKNEYKNPYE